MRLSERKESPLRHANISESPRPHYGRMRRFGDSENGKKRQTASRKLKNFPLPYGLLLSAEFAINATSPEAVSLLWQSPRSLRSRELDAAGVERIREITRWYFWRRATIKIASSDHRRDSFFDACVNVPTKCDGIFSLLRSLTRGATCIYRSVKNRSLPSYGRMLTFFRLFL